MRNELMNDAMIEEIRKIKESLWEESGQNFQHLLEIIRQETKKFLESVRKQDKKHTTS